LDYLKQYQPNVPLVALNGGSSISSESLKGLLVKDKVNYVVGRADDLIYNCSDAECNVKLSSATSNFRA
jgi:hypothetical protein